MRQLEGLVERIIDVMVEWREGTYRFLDDLSLLPLDLVGPLPTAYLVMEGAVRNLDEFQLLRYLGGDRARLVANENNRVLEQLYGIDPQEMFLISRAENPVSVGELLRQAGLPRQEALRKLCRLQAIDLLRSEAGGSIQLPTNAVAVSATEQSVIERFAERIGRRLDEQPVKLDEAAHRKRLADLLGRLGGMTHYELLDLNFHASPADVHAAYENLAPLVHPRHAERLGLEGGQDAAIRLLFERATQAYLTLVDPERRGRYNQSAGIEGVRMQSEGQRIQEQKEVARVSYERALQLVEAEDYHFAVELLRQASRIDPKAEYYALMGEIQAKNPHWLQQAADSYREAIRLQPDHVEYRLAMGSLLERLGDPGRARIHYRAVLQKEPAKAAAIDALSRLGDESGMLPKAVAGGFVSRLKRWLGLVPAAK
jgi:curved DNA-binding protein CbpA